MYMVLYLLNLLMTQKSNKAKKPIVMVPKYIYFLKSVENKYCISKKITTDVTIFLLHAVCIFTYCSGIQGMDDS